MTRALWWIRRDLRLTDNQALAAALKHAEQIIPVFIFDPVLLNSVYVGSKRFAFLLGGLRALDVALRTLGSRLIIRHGNPIDELTNLLSESGTEAIYAEDDYSPYAKYRDDRISAHLPLQLMGGLTIHPPGTVLKADGSPYTVFAPFSKAWRALSFPQESEIILPPPRIATPPDISSQSIPAEPALSSDIPFSPGETEAQRRLKAFVEGTIPPIFEYAEARHRLDIDGTSGLSPYLRFGMLSARQAVLAALQARQSAPNPQAQKGVETWLNELIWREFYMAILQHFPFVRQRSFRAELQEIPWGNNEDLFRRWSEGHTGYPVVDAAMRQLRQNGWMHNRARMIVASFLVKDLFIDWRWGERWFMEHLVDGDPAANNGGWQWTAGTGTDAAPYFRIFNPILQGKKCDPQGKYVRHWVPELSHVPEKFIHTPWEMPATVQKKAKCIIGQDYPLPLVDHQEARERTLAAYKQASAF